MFSSHSPTITWLEKETSWSGNSLECRRGFSELETHRRRLLTWRDPEKVQSCRGSASWYQELPHFPGEEADLKRVPDVRFKQKLQAAEQDSL